MLENILSATVSMTISLKKPFDETAGDINKVIFFFGGIHIAQWTFQMANTWCHKSSTGQGSFPRAI